MKITDYAPRAAPFDAYLTGRDLVGVEVGVDVGAHAEALLTYCSIAMLRLVDPWPNQWTKGYCEGRLARYHGRFDINHTTSVAAAQEWADEAARFHDDSLFLEYFDFVYIDQEHDGPAVATDLAAWWPLIKPGGVLGHRNYVEGRGSPLDKAIEYFVAGQKIATKYERYGSDIILFKR